MLVIKKNHGWRFSFKGGVRGGEDACHQTTVEVICDDCHCEDWLSLVVWKEEKVVFIQKMNGTLDFHSDNRKYF